MEHKFLRGKGFTYDQAVELASYVKGRWGDKGVVAGFDDDPDPSDRYLVYIKAMGAGRDKLIAVPGEILYSPDPFGLTDYIVFKMLQSLRPDEFCGLLRRR
jgi:hypothetical protein